ncbi:trypsin-like peptidase domain-containing protein [Couchioplanes caeruleus]|uniref:S1C family serine protease n=1 Tax=Couchioplanes caeruleus TaxID=56438 RepID=UPI0020BEEDCD|nr:trypsin-like peptidase domain-containing protein [Couchioplanes caeruleus]UQU62633.1 trypsin-like peptidase domain-containing protein [Couchioplanes caeruleus]
MTTRRLAAGAVVTAMTAALLAGCSDDAPSPAAAPSQSSAAAAADTGIVDVVSAVEPSVVTITTGEGLGSGVIYRADGVIVTNAHVVGSADRVQVSFADGTQVPGQVTGSDDLTDLAVVKVGRNGLPTVTVRQELPRQGETALALGSPLGFENTVTKGIISGVGRQIPGSATSGRPLVDLIQTDAAISPGNSGGALVDAQGRLVGVNEAYIPPSAGAVSLGFAIPASTVVDVTEQLLKAGKATHPFLGVVLATVTPQTAQALGMKVTTGALVRQVQPGSPAATAGIRAGDVIVGFEDATIRTVGDVYAALRKVKPGEKVTVKVNRDGAVTDIPVTLGTLSR